MVALNTAELVYFELDVDGSLNEYQDKKGMPAGVVCMSVGEVPVGRMRSMFLVSLGRGDGRRRNEEGSRTDASFSSSFVSCSGRWMREPDRSHHLSRSR